MVPILLGLNVLQQEMTKSYLSIIESITIFASFKITRGDEIEFYTYSGTFVGLELGSLQHTLFLFVWKNRDLK